LILDIQLVLLIIFTFIIHLIGTFAYSTRIAATRTGQIALSFAMFNVMILISRISNSFQAPLLAKRVEENLDIYINNIELDFRLILFSSTVATIFGILFTPTFQRILTNSVKKLSYYKSIPKLIFKGISLKGFVSIKNSFKIPSIDNIKGFFNNDKIPLKFIIFNMLATAVWTVGVIASIYAGYLEPELRATSGQLSSVINGLATIMLVLFIDPRVAMITDDVSNNLQTEGYLRRTLVALLVARLLGTLLAQIILVPSAMIIVSVANFI
jgi:hypothetical protein